MRLLFLIGFILLNYMSSAYAGDGIDCTKPVLNAVSLNAPTSFEMTCTNNTTATYSYFDLSIKELDKLPPATVDFTVIWPHTAHDIRPGDVGVVTGTIIFPASGVYSFDFTKAYGGETYTGIFCKNGANDDYKNCINANLVPRFLYVGSTDESTNSVVVFQCSLHPETGAIISPCTPYNLGNTIMHHASELIFMNINNKTYLYITGGFDAQGNILQCVVNTETGSLGSCQNAGTISSTAYDIGITFVETDDQLNVYIGDGIAYGKLWECPVIIANDSTNGTFGTCTASGQTYAYGAGYIKYRSFNGARYIYVPEGNDADVPGEGNVWQCLLDGAGHIPGTCTNAGESGSFDGPFSIAWWTNKDNTYAYVTDSTGGDPVGGYISQCTVDTETGLFVTDSCTIALNGIINPIDIFVAEIKNQSYAYFTSRDPGTVYQCAIEEKTGNFSVCYDFSTAPNGFAPARGLTFLP